ncbi:riboflavin synthase [Actinomadura rupiterrae]|uniref:riboflavin synthase n=1 Tax=Actinomadura rupiterrae TaxID=559627 RepID=UPI0020A35C84|nr:riboflavin synthase [Actinomadura rupiterrae]MCP2338387.1 riboflavin synthase [Actinomadura rupiterrae]
MFTGIVEELGEIREVASEGDSARLTIHGPLVTSDAVHGASIAVNGVCLTVVDVKDETFTADVIKETLDRSSLGGLEPGARVNLERPVRVSDRLGGHIVQGHVDGVGTILSREPGERWDVVTVSLPSDLARYVANKGSITIDGISLTVVEAGADRFTVALIPTTLALTTLGLKGPGDTVNLEVDVVAKYVERMITARPGTTVPQPKAEDAS